MEEVVPQPIRARAKVVYLGPVAPHWEVKYLSGERKLVDDFRQRVLSRPLMLWFGIRDLALNPTSRMDAPPGRNA